MKYDRWPAAYGFLKKPSISLFLASIVYKLPTLNKHAESESQKKISLFFHWSLESIEVGSQLHFFEVGQ